ncbi:MAG: metallophosphoesterase [Gammaproteobacteria bacterium]
MKIQFFSDIHLEFGALDLPASDADVIVAAGDIDVGARGVAWLAASGKPTVYVAGNHEFYGGEMQAVQAAIGNACVGTQVRFLECEATEIAGVRFLGATLWTDFLGENAELMDALSRQMNDYHHIRLGDRRVAPTDLLAVNTKARAWLEQELARPYAGKTVVVTHHAPLFASWHAGAASVFKGAYCNNLGRLVVDYRIDLWIHGHVHARSDYHANDLHVVCNPRGYDGYQVVDGFDPARTVTV